VAARERMWDVVSSSRDAKAERSSSGRYWRSRLRRDERFRLVGRRVESQALISRWWVLSVGVCSLLDASCDASRVSNACSKAR
jgi:hypothetical protein